MILVEPAPGDKIEVLRKRQPHYNRKMATYAEIKDYIKNEFGIHAHSVYIAAVKRKYGVGMQSVRSKDVTVKPVTFPNEETIKAIEKALIHYGIINEDSVPVLELPISHISVERTKQYNRKQATYKEIQNYIFDKYGVKTHTSYIAEIKRLHGIEMLSNRRKSKPKNEVKHPTKEMVKMIEDALIHFDIIKQDQITE